MTVVECLSCDKQIDHESEEFKEDWFKGARHDKNGTQRNLILCKECYEDHL